MGAKQSILLRIPNAITILNLANGFAALIAAVEGNYLLSAILVLLGLLLDFADGFAARMLKAGTPIGRELDSLSDLVCFAVVPALLSYCILAGKVSGNVAPVVVSTGQALPFPMLRFSPVVLVLAGAYRLARFNIQRDNGSFRGLPVPAAGIYVAGLTLVLAGTGSGTGAEAWGRIAAVAGSRVFILSSIAILSLLMISRIPLISLKTPHYRIRGNLHRYLLLGVSLVLLICLKWAALPLIIIAYLLISLAMNLKQTGKNK